MKKRSFLLSISFCFLAFYATANFGYFVYSNFAFYESYTKERILNVANYVKLGNTLLKEGKDQDVIGRLQEAKDLHQIDFFLLKRDGVKIASADMNSSRPAESFQMVPNKIANNESYFTMAIAPKNYELGIGINKDKWNYLAFVLNENKEALIKDIVIICLMASLIVLYFFRDIHTLLHAFRSIGRKGFSGIETRSAESEIIRRGLETYQEAVTDLAKRNELLNQQLLPALQSEMVSGKAPPYQFDATLVRTDINHFSTIFATHPVEPFMKIIDEFFTEATHIVSRYEGLVARFIGDEVIYYFRDTDHPNSVAIALSAIRDLNTLAARFDERTRRDHGYPFVVKSAISHGTLHFGKLVNAFEVSGGAFVESVRILSVISEKAFPVILFNEVLLPKVPPHFRTEEKMAIELKGIPGVTRLCSYLGHSPVEELLATLDTDRCYDLGYYRGDADLCTILRHFTRNTSKQDSRLLAHAMRGLGRIPLIRTGTELREAYTGLLAELLRLHSGARDRALAATVSACLHWFDRDAVSDRMISLLKDCLKAGDPRVSANAIEALTHLDHNVDDKTAMVLLENPNQRVRANAWIHQGRKHMGRAVVTGIQKMLSAEAQAPSLASAAYAVGELARWYRERDPVFVSTSGAFQQLLEQIRPLLDHPDESVRLQTRMALKKAGFSVQNRATREAEAA